MYSLPLVKKEDYVTLAAFRHELRKFLRFSERAAEAHGIAPQQYQALLAIEGAPEGAHMTVGALADRLQIAPHSCVGLVNRLVKGKLVTRSHSEEDRRRVFIKVSPQGKTILRQLASAHKKELGTVGPLLTGLLGRLKRK